RLDGRGAVFRGTATESVGSRYSLMGLPPNYGVRTCRNTRAELFANVQPGTIAEKRPAVPPATTILMLSGERNFGIGVESCAGTCECVGANPCSTESDSQGLASPRSPMQYV